MNSMPTGTIATTAGIAMAWLQRERSLRLVLVGDQKTNLSAFVLASKAYSAALRGPNKTRGWDLSFSFSFKYARKLKKKRGERV